MENLSINHEHKLSVTNFVRIGDVSYFEGPLLSLFQELNNGYLYLFDWVDRDKNNNRWLIYKVLPRDLLQYLQGKISHSDLYKKSNNNVYFTDIDYRNKSFYNYNIFALKEIPEIYLPNEDVFFEIEDCSSFERIKSLIMNLLSTQKENEYLRPISYRKLSKKIQENYISNKISFDEKNKWIRHRVFPTSTNRMASIVFNKYIHINKINVITDKVINIKTNEYANRYDQKFSKKPELEIYRSRR